LSVRKGRNLSDSPAIQEPTRVAFWGTAARGLAPAAIPALARLWPAIRPLGRGPAVFQTRGRPAIPQRGRDGL